MTSSARRGIAAISGLLYNYKFKIAMNYAVIDFIAGKIKN